MATDGIRFAADDGEKQWPLVVPRALFTVYQPIIGGIAALVWLNLYEMAGRTVAAEGVAAELARRLAVTPSTVEDALVALEGARLLERGAEGIVLHWPADGLSDNEKGVEAPITAATSTPTSPSTSTSVPMTTQSVAVGTEEDRGRAAEIVSAVIDESAAAAAPVVDGRWDSDEAGLKAVVAFYHQRIGMLGPSQFEKLRFWLEEMGMSSDVVALAIEETVQNAKTPRMNYLEAVLRNWYNDGVRTVADLQRSKQTRSSALPQRSEGSPNAAAYETIDPDAVRRWKEMYADEYDG